MVADTLGAEPRLGFAVAVNIPFVWIALPIAALWCRRNPAPGLAAAGFLFTNGLSHIFGAFTPMGYSPGTLTAGIIFIPLSVWVFGSFFGRSKLLSYPVLAANLLGAILAQAGLRVLLKGLMAESIPIPVATIIQVIDPAVLLLVPWLANRIWPSTPVPETAATVGR